MTKDDTTPADEVLAEIRRLKAVPEPETVEGAVETDALEVDGFQDLDAFFDDTLPLPVHGKVYRIPPASAELGLLCSRLMMAGEQVARRGKVSNGLVGKLDDDEELDLYQRLLGHVEFLPGTGSPAEYDDEGNVVTEEVPPDPNPLYDPDRDVWQQLMDDGVDWQRIQHVGATAMVWTAVGKPAAQAFWASGARPKASVTPPKAPEDRRRKGTGKSGRPGSAGGTTNRSKGGKGRATAGATSSASGD